MRLNIMRNLVIATTLLSASLPLLAAEPAGKSKSKASPYTRWEHQQAKQRYWCTYRYTNRSGTKTYQYVLFYPDKARKAFYYFRDRSGRVWACCRRPGAAGYIPGVMKWYRKDRRGRWVARDEGECPRPPDGSRRIVAEDNSSLPVSPPPAEFATLSESDRAEAVRFHQLLAEVAIEDGKIVGLDCGRCQSVNDAALADIGKVASLRRLYLDSTSVTDQGLKQLSKLNNLVHLDLSQTRVSAQGLKQLESLKGLRTLILRGCYVSPKAVANLRRSNKRLLVTSPSPEEDYFGPPGPFRGPPAPPPPPPKPG